MTSNDDPFADRYGSTTTTDEQDTDETADASDASDAEDSSGASGAKTVQEQVHLSMYLPDDLVREFRLRYSELNVEWQREHDEELPKNAEYYPAALRVALDHPEALAEELGLD